MARMPTKRLELHVIRAHSACNLNRGENGQNKTMIFGGVQRLRISSQCKKKALRDSFVLDDFRAQAQKRYGMVPMVRTRDAAIFIKKCIVAKFRKVKADDPKFENKINEALKSIVTLFSKSESGLQTQNIPYSLAELQFMADSMIDIREDGEIELFDIKKQISKDNEKRDSVGALCPDLQMFGRFSTAKYYLADIDTPLQVPDAYTVHESKVEQDYFTAVDDLSEKKGSAHIGTRFFGTGVFYEYYCLDVSLLTRNMKAAYVNLGDLEVQELTSNMIEALVYAIVLTNPKGNQNNNANHDLPSAFYLSFGSASPSTADSIFEKPVKVDREDGGYMTGAIKRFLEWVDLEKDRYGNLMGDDISWGMEQDEKVKLPNSCNSLEDIIKWVDGQIGDAIGSVISS